MNKPKNLPEPPRQSPGSSLSRRDFLTLVWKALLFLGSLLGLAGLLRFLDYQSAPAEPSAFDLGLPSQYPSGSRTRIAAAKAVLVDTSAGLAAYSLVCPHLGCEVNLTPDGFACPCHGSRFDSGGKLIHGPATKGLRQLKLSQDVSGHLILSIK